MTSSDSDDDTESSASTSDSSESEGDVAYVFLEDDKKEMGEAFQVSEDMNTVSRLEQLEELM